MLHVNQVSIIQCKLPLRSQPVMHVQVCLVMVTAKILAERAGVTQALDDTIHITCVAPVSQAH